MYEGIEEATVANKAPTGARPSKAKGEKAKAAGYQNKSEAKAKPAAGRKHTHRRLISRFEQQVTTKDLLPLDDDVVEHLGGEFLTIFNGVANVWHHS